MGVPAVGISGFIIARYRPFKMALTMFATALAQVLVTTITILTGLQYAAVRPVFEILIINGCLITPFIVSGLLFWKAARG